MSRHLLIPPNTDFIDPRRTKDKTGNIYSRLVSSRTLFTANGAGTTTTAVTAAPAPSTNDNNVVRRGDRFKLFTAAGVLKEETVFEVTGISGAQTITFAPAAAVATASTDFGKLVGAVDYDDIESLESVLLLNGYSQLDLNKLTINDKIWAYRQKIDPGSIGGV